MGVLGEMSELELFTYLRENLLADLKSSNGQYDRTDCFSNSNKLVIELKCRRTHYEELLIEKKKFDALNAKAAELSFNACYINSTPQGIYGWNLSSVEIQWQEQLMPATTDFENVEKVSKVIGYLPIATAIQLSGAIIYQ